MFRQAGSTKMLLMDFALDHRNFSLATIATTADWTIGVGDCSDDFVRVDCSAFDLR